MKFPLNEEDVTQLKILHKSVKDKRQADKIKTILMLNDGYTSIQISLILMIDNDTITNWKKKFIKSTNIETWLSYNYIGYDGKLNKFQLEDLRNYIKDNLVICSKQLIPYIKEKFGIDYSNNGIMHLLKTLNFSYKQLVKFNEKSDAEVQNQFLQGFEALNYTLDEREVILFMDGVHPQHNTHTTRAWIEKGKEKFIQCNTGRERININGAYNPNNQDLIAIESDSINADSTIKLFQLIETTYADKDTIYIICDNAKYYKCKLIDEYLSSSKINLIFLPPYSPNLNLIERVWKFLKKKVINTIYYEKFSSFKEAVLKFFNNSNEYRDELKKSIGLKFHIIYPDYPKTILG